MATANHNSVFISFRREKQTQKTPKPHTDTCTGPTGLPSALCSPTKTNEQSFGELGQRNSLPKPAGLFCAKALLWDEKSPPPVLVVPNRLLDVPVDVPNPKLVLVEEVAGWLNVVEPNNPPGDRKRLFIICNHQLMEVFLLLFGVCFCWLAVFFLVAFVDAWGLFRFPRPVPLFFNNIFPSDHVLHYNPSTHLVLSACSRRGLQYYCSTRRPMSQTLLRLSCQSQHLKISITA